MRIALLTYRGNMFCGGQGIYAAYLARELVALGHEVHVIAGPPLPELEPGIPLHVIPNENFFGRALAAPHGSNHHSEIEHHIGDPLTGTVIGELPAAAFPFEKSPDHMLLARRLPVEDRDREAVLLQVQGEIAAHHTQPVDADDLFFQAFGKDGFPFSNDLRIKGGMAVTGCLQFQGTVGGFELLSGAAVLTVAFLALFLIEVFVHFCLQGGFQKFFQQGGEGAVFSKQGFARAKLFQGFLLCLFVVEFFFTHKITVLRSTNFLNLDTLYFTPSNS